MHQVIYLDVLIFLNLFINYFLLLATKKFLNLNSRRLRTLIAAGLGAIYSMVILIPNINTFISIFMSIVMAGIITYISFGYRSHKFFLKCLCCFFSISFMFSGIVYLFWKMFLPERLLVNNGIIYFNFSPIILICITVIAYILIRLFQRMTGRSNLESEYYRARITVDNRYCNIMTKIDTGNSLKEPFSNLPVIVVSEDSIVKILPGGGKEIIDNPKKLKCRMIPYNVVGSEGVLKGFKPDKLIIYTGDKPIEKEAYVAVCKKGTFKEGFDALMNPLLLE